VNNGIEQWMIWNEMVTEDTIRAGGKVALLKVIRDLGYDPAPIFAGAGFDYNFLGNSNAADSVAMFGKLFVHSVKSTGCSYIGLLVGAEATLAWLGRTGFVARNSENVALALASIGEYLDNYDHSSVVVLKRMNDCVSISYSPLLFFEGQDQWLVGVMSCGVKIMRELCSESWVPSEVTFAIAKPLDIRPYEVFFRTKLIFEATETAMLFDASWLEYPIENAQPELRRLLLKDVDQAVIYDPKNFPLDVLRITRTLIGTGECSATKIGTLLGLRPNAFYRRLSVHGTSFKQVVDEARFEMAKQLMLNTSMSLKQISARLEYSDITAFTRAFNRWSGMPPGEWRRRSRLGQLSTFN
jgi:AraC-like DNA-binding protein